MLLMPMVVSKNKEPFEVLLRKFKKKCEIAGVLSDIKKNQRYEKPSVKKRREVNAVKRKLFNKQRKLSRLRGY